MNLFRQLFGEPDTKASHQATAATPSPAQAQVTTAASDLRTRPLSDPESAPVTEHGLLHAVATDVGRSRQINQDSALALALNLETFETSPVMGVFIVADGMGGHHDGEQASAIAVRTIASDILDTLILPQIGSTSSDEPTPGRVMSIMSDAMNQANQAVQLNAPNSGTTATVAVVIGSKLHITHVGDSRAYLVTPEGIEALTRDHSLVKRLQELGQLSEEDLEHHPQRNVLYRAIGQGDSLEVDENSRYLPPGSRLVLCSDGLWGVLGDTRLGQLARVPDLRAACRGLIQEANDRGGPDNITVVIVQAPE